MSKRGKSVLLAIILLGLGVRLVGIDFGLPFLYHNDEPIIVNYALAYGSGDLNPHFFKIPPFLSYVLFFLYGIFYFLGRCVGIFGSVKDFGFLFLNDPTSFYLIGRIVAGVIPGTLSIFLMYRLGRAVFSRSTGLLAALFLSVNFLHVRDSHYIYPDIPLVLFILIYFVVLNGLYEKDRSRDFILCGFVMGLAVSMKYSGVFLTIPAIPVLMRSMLRSRKNTAAFFKKSFFYICFFGLALFITNPYMLLDHRFFWSNVTRMPFYRVNFMYHISTSLFGACGRWMCFAGLIGSVFVIKRKNIFGIFLGSFMVLYYLLIAQTSQPAERYIFPVLPVLLLFAAYAVMSVIELMRAKGAKVLAGVSCVTILMAPSAINTYYCDRLLAGDDTRTSSYDWVMSNIPADTVITLDATGPVFPSLKQKKGLIQESLARFDNPKFDSPKGSLNYKVKLFMENPGYPAHTYQLNYLRTPAANDRFLMIYPVVPLDVSVLKSGGVQYVILNNVLLGDPGDPFLKALEGEAVLIKEFSPYKDGITRIKPLEASNIAAAPFSERELRDRKTLGPVIRVYKMKGMEEGRQNQPTAFK